MYALAWKSKQNCSWSCMHNDTAGNHKQATGPTDNSPAVLRQQEEGNPSSDYSSPGLEPAIHICRLAYK